MKILENGNLSKPACDICIMIGIGLIWGGAYLFNDDTSNLTLWLCVSLGAVLASMGGWCSFANRVGIKPFGTNWKKIRKTYEKKDGDA